MICHKIECRTNHRWRHAISLLVLLSLTSQSNAREMIDGGDFERGKSAWSMWHCKGIGNIGVFYSTSNDTRPG